jgi:quercetin dioxygenase-like cupin family protein
MATPHVLGRGDATPPFVIQTVEGLPIKGEVHVKKLLHGRNALLIEVRIRGGTVTPAHQHAHESYLYVVQGRVRATIGSDVYDLGPGDAVLHPASVDHISEALEDAVWIEIKTPAEETW